jgi:hypothetical protein
LANTLSEATKKEDDANNYGRGPIKT